MRRRWAIGAALASVVVLVGAGCDSGSESTSPPDHSPVPTVPPPTEGETTTGPPAATTSEETTPVETTPSQTAPHETTPEEATPGETTGAAPTPRYALGPTRRCLVRAGMRVGNVGGSDSRLQALGDLAQRTSLEIRRGDDVVGLAITDVQLLSDLLAVPNDPYRIETEGNALLMFKPAARELSRRVRECLRG